jgi:TIR domain
VAVKQVRVSDLSGRQATEEQFAKLVVHEHPQYQGPITLDVLPEELAELPDSDQYVSIEVIQPGERSGQRALLSVERFNQLAAGGHMHSILVNEASQTMDVTDTYGTPWCPRITREHRKAAGQNGSSVCQGLVLDGRGQPRGYRLVDRFWVGRVRIASSGQVIGGGRMATSSFFISYTAADDAWAQWIAWQLEAAGYTTSIQAWDSRPGNDFVAWMDQQLRNAGRVLVVLSPAYEKATSFTVPEWTAA